MTRRSRVRGGQLAIVYVVALFQILLLPVPGSAQARAVVTGQAFDPTGAVLPGVTVELLSPGAASPRTALTGDDGRYRFEAAPPGATRLTFRLINFTTARHDVTVGTDSQVIVDATLSVAASADITITAPRTFRNLADLPRPAESVIGVAGAASEGAITAEQLAIRPMARAGEILETVPGLIVSQHSGEGKANQYYLRGFNLDHGTDFSMTVAGMPVNLPTHAHGHGYADSNFLIPELVSGIQFRKGPYYAEDGDFSAAGSSTINYFNVLDDPIVEVSGGAHGWRRFLGAVSPTIAGGVLLGALDVTSNDGPWQRPDDYQKVSAVLRYSRGDARNGFSLTGIGYSADWNATDQVPVRAVRDGRISRFGHVDPTDHGRTNRYGLAADAQHAGDRNSTRVTAYAQRYALNLASNFTYFLDDPVNGDQFEQEDRRWLAGGGVTHRRLGRFAGRSVESVAGAKTRHDAIGKVALYKAANGRRLSTTRQDSVTQSSVGLFADVEVEWSPRVRTTAGIRGDIYRYAVDAVDPGNAGRVTDGLASPKASLVLGLWPDTEIYLNAGLGFHSNDARSATVPRDPAARPMDRVAPLVRARGAELGARTVRLAGLQTTAALWYLGFDSELVFLGDAGTTEAGRPSRRAGIEITNYARPRPWLTLDLDLAFSRAHFSDADPAGRRIPGALDRVITAGASIDRAGTGASGISGGVRFRHFGQRPLVEDGSIMSPATSLLNAEAGYRVSPRVRLVLEVFNLADAEVSDIDYYYTSRLPDEPRDGIADVHTHPAVPRSARVALRVSF